MGNVIKFENKALCKNNKELANAMRSLADDVEKGMELSTVIVVMEDVSGNLKREAYGTKPCDWARLGGLLFMATQQATLVEKE